MKKIGGFEINDIKFTKLIATDSYWYEDKEYILNSVVLSINEMREVTKATHSIDYELFNSVNR